MNTSLHLITHQRAIRQKFTTSPARLSKSLEQEWGSASCGACFPLFRPLFQSSHLLQRGSLGWWTPASPRQHQTPYACLSGCRLHVFARRHQSSLPWTSASMHRKTAPYHKSRGEREQVWSVFHCFQPEAGHLAAAQMGRWWQFPALCAAACAWALPVCSLTAWSPACFQSAFFPGMQHFTRKARVSLPKSLGIKFVYGLKNISVIKLREPGPRLDIIKISITINKSKQHTLGSMIMCHNDLKRHIYLE